MKFEFLRIFKVAFQRIQVCIERMKFTFLRIQVCSERINFVFLRIQVIKFAFLRIQIFIQKNEVCVSENSNFHPKELSLRFREFKFVSKESSLCFKKSGLHRSPWFTSKE